MKNIIIIILLSFASLSFSQNKNLEKDEILADSISNLSKTVNEQDKKIKDLREEINSLKPVIEESRIGKGFFQTIMTGYTSIIAVLIILGSIISGYFFNRAIQTQVTNKITRLERTINRNIAAQSKEFDEFKKNIEKDIEEGKRHELIADRDISRSMCIINESNKRYDVAFDWAISAMDASRKLKHYEQLLVWVH